MGLGPVLVDFADATGSRRIKTREKRSLKVIHGGAGVVVNEQVADSKRDIGQTAFLVGVIKGQCVGVIMMSELKPVSRPAFSNRGTAALKSPFLMASNAST